MLRVGFVLRSTEIQPACFRFVSIVPVNRGASRRVCAFAMMRVPPATSDLRACHGATTSLPGHDLNRGYDKVTVHEYYKHASVFSGDQRRRRRVEVIYYARGTRPAAYDGWCAPFAYDGGTHRHLGNLSSNGREACTETHRTPVNRGASRSDQS